MSSSVITTLIGLVIFYIGLKMFSSGMQSMGNMEHLSYFIHNPYWMFLGGVVMTLLWQSSSLSTTAIIGLVAIFAASMIPVIIMGSVLEVGKITTAVWLHKYWDKATLLMKSYLTIAVLLLRVIH